jgi:glucose/arabinose dehydrogenase
VVPFLLTALAWPAAGQAAPEVLRPNLAVRTAATGLDQPVQVAFLGLNDMLVTEKASGRVKRVVNGVVQSTVLDLAVNSASERGLLGIALHPDFPLNPRVYLFWSEALSGTDSITLEDVALLGNRVDSFLWNGMTLTWEKNLIRLRAFQADAGQPLRGNHDGGVVRFGQDGKLYIIIGDTGRRGWTQNLANGPFGPGIPDDQFGGPQPDNAHLTGVILRLNDDGTTPVDNPFFGFGAAMGGEVGANLQKIYSYGLRNSFGMAIDPKTGTLWEQENGDDSFSELNIAAPGFNSGWVQIMGPPERIGQFKSIETDPTAPQPFAAGGYFGLQQIRWLPTNIADTPAQALSRLVMFPGAHYSAPELAWKFEVAPAGIGFVNGNALGQQYNGDLFVGAARTFLEGGFIWHLNLAGNRRRIGVDDPRLEDRVADNINKWELTESESLLFGRNFGVVTDIQTGPNGNLYLVSLDNGVIYEIFRR